MLQEILAKTFSVTKYWVVMCRARLGSKARAWAQLEQAQASIHGEPGPSSRLRLRPQLE